MSLGSRTVANNVSSNRANEDIHWHSSSMVPRVIGASVDQEHYNSYVSIHHSSTEKGCHSMRSRQLSGIAISFLALALATTAIAQQQEDKSKRPSPPGMSSISLCRKKVT